MINVYLQAAGFSKVENIWSELYPDSFGSEAEEDRWVDELFPDAESPEELSSGKTLSFVLSYVFCISLM